MQGKKYSINKFISNSRLIQGLSPHTYTINPSQQVDIIIHHTNIIHFTMSYFIKYPHYLKNKLASLSQQQLTNLLIVVLVESKEEVEMFNYVQMAAIAHHVNVMPCFTVEEVRQCLEDIYHVR